MLEQRECVVLLERAEGQRAEPGEREPRADRALAAGEQEADARRQRRHEHLSQPGVHEPEHLVVIEREHHRRRERPEMSRERIDVVRTPAARRNPRSVGSTVRQSSRTTLEPSPAGAVEERAHESRLADTGDAVQATRPASRPPELREGAKLRLAPHEGSGTHGQGRRHATTIDQPLQIRGKQSPPADRSAVPRGARPWLTRVRRGLVGSTFNRSSGDNRQAAIAEGSSGWQH